LAFWDVILAFDPDLAGQLANKLDLSDLETVLAITSRGKETYKTRTST